MEKKEIEKLAEGGDCQALRRLGEFYYFGKNNVNVDGKKAVEYFEKALALGDAESCEQLAWIYCDGKSGVQVDGYKAIKYFGKVKNWGSIAEIYRDGKYGVTQDANKAVEFFIKAGDWFQTAKIYEEGCGEIEPNRQKAVEFYEKGSYEKEIAELNEVKENFSELVKLSGDENAEATYKLAEIYWKGLGGAEQSPKKALALFEKAAALNYPPAFESLGEIYKFGKCGVQQNGQKALEYLTKFFEVSPDGFIVENIVEIYEKGCGEIKPDGRKALEYDYAHNLHSSLYNCCSFDEKNGGIKRDGLKLLKVYERRLQKLQNLEAPKIIIADELKNIAKIYEEGFDGVAPDRQKAAEFQKKIDELI